MSRVPRTKSKTGYYHVMLRGNARQILFESDSDRRAFLATLDRSLEEPGLRLIAWCLMDNHVHLLVDDPEGKISHAIRRLATSYAMRYNRKADRVGHVFQDRFRSQPIDTERQLLEVVRYIHNNPEEAGICPAGEYPWSSYSEYTGHSIRCGTDSVLEMLGGAEGFRSFCSERASIAYQPSFGKKPTEQMLIESALELLGVDDLSIIKSMSVDQRNRALAKLRDGGFSIRQAERVTGIGRGAIERAFRTA